jgi:nitrile hydratase beta subunit
MAVLSAAMVPEVVKTGASTRRPDEGVTPRFKAGDRVVARNINPVGHTRLPRYVRGRQGVIHHDHGVFVFPDTSAHGGGDKPQHVYTVRFDARDLWGPTASERDSLYIDLWDDYLDPA